MVVEKRRTIGPTLPPHLLRQQQQHQQQGGGGVDNGGNNGDSSSGNGSIGGGVNTREDELKIVSSSSSRLIGPQQQQQQQNKKPSAMCPQGPPLIGPRQPPIGPQPPPSSLLSTAQVVSARPIIGPVARRPKPGCTTTATTTRQIGPTLPPQFQAGRYSTTTDAAISTSTKTEKTIMKTAIITEEQEEEGEEEEGFGPMPATAADEARLASFTAADEFEERARLAKERLTKVVSILCKERRYRDKRRNHSRVATLLTFCPPVFLCVFLFFSFLFFSTYRALHPTYTILYIPNIYIWFFFYGPSPSPLSPPTAHTRIHTHTKKKNVITIRMPTTAHSESTRILDDRVT